MNQYIDHTLLKPEATREQIISLCQEAAQYNFKSVCINPFWVKAARKELNALKSTNVDVCTVIGFPLGATSTEAKVFETKKAISDGASEIDMVINIGALKSGLQEVVFQDIEAVVLACQGKVLKVIFETCLLSEEEIILATNLSIKAGATFIKTSTGFSTSGANPEVVSLMIKEASGKAKVKASGGVRSFEDAKMYIDMGVQRLGTSSGVQIIQGQKSDSDY